MRFLDREQILRAVDMPGLIDDLAKGFRGAHVGPPRQVSPVPGGDDRLLLQMAAFDETGAGAVKIATVFPQNPQVGRPAIQAAIVVLSEHGQPQAVLDGTTVTRLRTGAASALASTYLSRPDSRRLLLIGSGGLAPHMAQAHSAARPIEEVMVWARRPEALAETVARTQALVGDHVEVRPADDLQAAVGAADIVSSATSSREPLVLGAWLKPGVFVDLVGSFSPTAREVDDEAVLRARLFVDTYEGAHSEAGDLLDPMSRGVIAEDAIEGDLAELVTGRAPGRRTDEEITLFKSVGAAMEDLVAARHLLARADAG